jgi:histidine triad (HIT) family protein
VATLFTRIIEEEIPSVRIYEDASCIAILDIAPVNKGHILVIAREEYETLIDCPDETLSHLITTAKKLAARMKERLGCDGFNLMINNGAASGQEVPHLHIHLIPRYSGDGKTPRMTKERYEEDEMVLYGKRLS